jgi:NAD(P)-dependent dehydrogenase (short-subunit alcohol dehydrogenase family)
VRVAGKSVVVIGGTSGIGAATVRLLVAEGAEVLFAGRRPAPGEGLAGELGDRAGFQRADATDEPQVAALFAEALERFGHVDGTVNCAGESVAGSSIADTDVTQLGRLVADLAASAAAITKHAARAMLPRARGSIVHVTSVAADAGGWSGYAYSAGKAAVAQIVRSAAVELGEGGIRVNAVSPGPITTGMFAKAAGVPADEADQMTMPDADFVTLAEHAPSGPTR